LMVEQNEEYYGTKFCITVDGGPAMGAQRHALRLCKPVQARTADLAAPTTHSGVTTGVSAYDRAVTIRALANPATTPEELVRPGHIFPLRYTPGGVLTRGGHTEASVDLARWAGLQV
jgi:3,4-dihydroxy 2-butanone 4-phosphate synthase/GTP cyclohydrolase II